jgi:hypothetical protein
MASLLAYLLLVAVAQSEEPVVANPTLRAELLKRRDEDQVVRMALLKNSVASTKGSLQPAPEDIAEMARIDADNTRWLKEVIDRSGWPGRTQVGMDGANAAWLLVQHADADRAFQKHCLELMQQLPADEISQTDLAYLVDRVRVGEGQPQVYGTQLDDDLQPAPIEDAEHVDERRAAIGLPPLAEYLRSAEELFRPASKEVEPARDAAQPAPARPAGSPQAVVATPRLVPRLACCRRRRAEGRPLRGNRNRRAAFRR